MRIVKLLDHEFASFAVSSLVAHLKAQNRVQIERSRRTWALQLVGLLKIGGREVPEVEPSVNFSAREPGRGMIVPQCQRPVEIVFSFGPLREVEMIATASIRLVRLVECFEFAGDRTRSLLGGVFAVSLNASLV